MMDNELRLRFPVFLSGMNMTMRNLRCLKSSARRFWPDGARRAVSARRRSGFFKFLAAPKKIPGINKKILISA